MPIIAEHRNRRTALSSRPNKDSVCISTLKPLKENKQKSDHTNNNQGEIWAKRHTPGIPALKWLRQEIYKLGQLGLHLDLRNQTNESNPLNP